MNTSQQTGFNRTRLERVSDHIQRNYIEPRRLAGCQLTINRRGQQAYSRSFGHQDLASGKPMAEGALFRLLSMTKQVTAVALMTLYERGLFQLNDPVSRFAPSWADLRVWVSGEGEDMVTEPLRRPVTVRDLLTHTSGLIYAVGWPGVAVSHPVERIYRELDVRVASSGLSNTEFLDKLSRAPLMHQPGDRWTYSIATDVCGALIEIIAGKPFAQYLREEVLEPLGMSDTSFHLMPQDADSLCTNYVLGPDMNLHVLPDDPAICNYSPHLKYSSGGGGLLSSTADMVRFCEMLRRGGELNGSRVLGPRTLAMMRMNHLPDGKSVAQFTSDPYFIERYAGVGCGLGFYVNQGVLASGALGGDAYSGGGAATTFFLVDPVEDLSVVFMSQLIPFDPYGIREQVRSIIYSAIET